jgi:hypothetical protein
MPPNRKLLRWRLEQEPAETHVWPWRYANVFRPFTDDVRRKLRRLKCQSNEDAGRLDTMVAVWELCLFGDASAVEEAWRLAASIGET